MSTTMTTIADAPPARHKKKQSSLQLFLLMGFFIGLVILRFLQAPQEELLRQQQQAKRVDARTGSNKSVTTTTTGENKMQPPPPIPDVFYTRARRDRSGAVILDMLLAHAFAFAHERTYAGACRFPAHLDPDVITTTLEKDDAAFAVHTAMIAALGLSEVLVFACPDKMMEEEKDEEHADTEPAWSRLILDRQVYTRHDTDLMTSAWQAQVNALRRGLETASSTDNHSISESREIRVAVHIRRGDVTPCHVEDFRYLPNQHYLAILQDYLASVAAANETVSVTIYSETESMEDWREFDAYNLQLDTPITQVWMDLMEADVLILSKSSFSLVPALVRGDTLSSPALTVYYTPFWYQPLVQWTVVDDDRVRESVRIVQRMKREMCPHNDDEKDGDDRV